jgi:aldose 1-epimerase
MELYSLATRDGIALDVAGYGGSIVSLRVPDRSGNMGDVVLGFDSLEEYQQHPYFGALLGRYCNRIANARFELQGVEFRLARNDGRHSLHGGWKGFDKVFWNIKDVSTPENPALELTYRSPDGEEGYPGNLDITVIYSLPADNELRIDYQGKTDKDTVVNLTSHSYFNLAGHGQGDVLGHLVEIAADRFTVIDQDLIPTGEFRSVTGTAFDFRRPMPIGARIAAKNEDDEQLRRGNGYDHNFVLNGVAGSLRLAARVTDPLSGRVMEVLTEPGVQFYTGNALQNRLRGKSGKVYGPRSGFCLETQHFPDSPNQPAFPSTILRPSEPFHSTTVYRFTLGRI